MSPHGITPANPELNETFGKPTNRAGDRARFQDILKEESSGGKKAPNSEPQPSALTAGFLKNRDSDSGLTGADLNSKHNIVKHYGKMSAWEKYKDDQLLSNPGGDKYFLENKNTIKASQEQDTFLGRLSKDISDSISNMKNFFGHLLFGAETHYRDENNNIKEAQQDGLFGSVLDFFKSLGSALSFGTWTPETEKAPQGFLERLTYSLSKLKQAFFGDLLEGGGGSVVHMAEDIVLTGWNLAETIPDATIGNLDVGRKMTTTIFDNGQVAIDYLTDVMPTGEAWLRVHAVDLKGLEDLKIPLIYNLRMPERSSGDMRWQYIRNTPFRKTIESIGSVLADVVTMQLLGDTKFFSEKGNERH